MIELKNLIRAFNSTKKYLLILTFLTGIVLIINIFSDNLDIKEQILKMFSKPGENITITTLSLTFYFILMSHVYFFEDLKNKYELIFSRINKKRWLTKKILFIIAITIILELLLSLIIYLLSKNNIYNQIEYFFLNNLTYTLIMIFISLIIRLIITNNFFQTIMYLSTGIIIYETYKAFYIIIIPICIITLYILIQKKKVN